jgi:hypothetical protein
MLQPGSLSYITGPIVAIVVMVLLTLFMRWAFGGSSTGGMRRRRPSPVRRRSAHPGGTLSRRESALALRAVLSDAGIRSTVPLPRGARADVLVFPEDAPPRPRTRRVLPGGLTEDLRAPRPSLRPVRPPREGRSPARQPGRSTRRISAPRPCSRSTKSG